MTTSGTALICLACILALAQGVRAADSAVTGLITPSEARVVFSAPASPNPEPTVDVLWCSGDERAAGRALDAAELAASYATIAKLETSDIVSTVRTRPIDKNAFLSKLSSADAEIARNQPLVQADQGDGGVEAVLREVIAKGLRPAIASSDKSHFMPNYVAVYICPDLDLANETARLFLQIKNLSQTGQAQRAAAALRKDLPGITVARGIEVVGNKAPAGSEIRYFFNEDAAIAARVATGISKVTSTTFVAKQIGGYEDRVRRGTLEAWIVE